jgi:prolyl-tRNA editing enzyme YbaK/EbsC (Cys-tRNA(Pro) deacylase)
MAQNGRSLQRVQDALARYGMALEIERFPSSTRTAADAARAVGCEVGQIAKSLVFRSAVSGEPVLIVASGANRVDPAKAGEAVGEPLAMADADYVRERTGFAIGGVPPVGHDASLRILLDRDLFGFERILAAAGTPDAVSATTPAQLQEFTGATVIDVNQ